MIGGGPNHKSHAMTSPETSKEEVFVGAKISKNGRSEAVAWCWHVTRNSFKGEGLNLKLKFENTKLVDVVE